MSHSETESRRQGGRGGKRKDMEQMEEEMTWEQMILQQGRTQ